MDSTRSISLMLLTLFLSATLTQQVAGDTIIITPSTDSPCPTEFPRDLCFTLQQYLSNGVNDSNITLELQPGTHYLDFDLVVSRVSSFIMKGVNATIVMDCQSQLIFGKVCNFDFSYVDTIHFSGIKFINADININPYIRDVEKFIFEYCSYHSRNPLRIEWTSSAEILNSSFVGEDRGSGGLDFFRTSSVSIKQCHFLSNIPQRRATSSEGGGVSASTCSNVVISQSVFMNYQAGRVGRAVSATDSNLSILQSIFVNNRAVQGGAIQVWNSNQERNLTIINSTFTNNTATSHGGAVFCNGAAVKVSASAFTRNQANRKGGAIYVFGKFANKTSLAVSNSSFYSNIGIGAICSRTSRFIPNITISISTSHFIGNTDSRGGEAIYSDSSLVVTHCTFSNHRETRPHRSDSGSAITVELPNLIGNSPTITIEHTNFTNNSGSSRGGAIQASGGLTLAVVNCYFNNNTAKVHSGGAINYNRGEYMVVINSTFTNNIGNNGGAIDAICKHLSIVNSIFKDNKALYGSGGAINLPYMNINITVFNSYFINNNAENGLFRGSSGGAIYLRRSRSINITSSAFINNTATHCGVLDVQRDVFHKRVTFNTSIFDQNRATGEPLTDKISGGVICIRNASIIVLNSTFSHNSAAGNAGVIQVEGSTVEVNRSTFNRNMARGDGGVFITRQNSSQFSLEQSSFAHNQAGSYGGVMYVGSAGSNVDIDRCTFNFNEASGKGGVAFITNSTMEVHDTHFNKNRADIGGSISACSSEVYIDPSVQLINSVDPIQSLCTSYDEATVSITTTSPLSQDNDTTSSIEATTDITSTSPLSQDDTTSSIEATTDITSTSPLSQDNDTTSSTEATTDITSTSPLSQDNDTTSSTEANTDITTTSPLSQDNDTTSSTEANTDITTTSPLSQDNDTTSSTEASTDITTTSPLSQDNDTTSSTEASTDITTTSPLSQDNDTTSSTEASTDITKSFIINTTSRGTNAITDLISVICCLCLVFMIWQ